MIKVKVDSIEIEVPRHYTVLQAVESAGIEVPRFCFHERLSIAGNCRMCLVEIKGGPPKPQTSCALGVTDLRPGPNGEPAEIITNSDMVKKARSGALEFLLINHPLDCPICDQGGECDLQDQAMAYGHENSRYREAKRAVEDKYIGPLVKTVMTRCIHCTRCVRFSTEVAGINELGLIGRGENAEITTYLEAAMTSEMQGNIIDLCPVGALTAKPYAFHARPWELQKTNSIDVMDAVGSAIRVDSRGREVMRILPRLNEEVNEEWISDKARFIFDGLKSRRLDQPYIKENGELRPASWDEALELVAAQLKHTSPNQIGAIAGDLAGVEEMYALKLLLNKLGSGQLDCRQDGAEFNPSLGRGSYIFNSSIADISKADCVLLIGINPRLEAAVINSKLIQHYKATRVPIALIGEASDLRYPYLHLGDNTDALEALISGEHEFCKLLKAAKFPMIILGSGAIAGKNGSLLLEHVIKFAVDNAVVRSDWNGFNVLHHAASRVGGLDIGFVPSRPIVSARYLVRNMDVLFLLGADEVELVQRDKFTVYIGSHGDKAANMADVILPAAAYTEKSALYVNTEGRVQLTERAIFPPGLAKEDWAIICALANKCEIELPFYSLDSLRSALFKEYTHLAEFDKFIASDIEDLYKVAQGSLNALHKENLRAAVSDFYQTNPIARASKVMEQCSLLVQKQKVEQ